VYTDQETGYQWSKQEEQPGWEWKNQRAREEEQRALELIADQGAMIKGTWPLEYAMLAADRSRPLRRSSRSQHSAHHALGMIA
jgi:hypothetical protein